MPKSKLTWYKTSARAILYKLKKLNQHELAAMLNVSQPAMSYRLNNMYESVFEDCLRLFRLAGYELVEMEEKK